jgi:hypothetical protein
MACFLTKTVKGEPNNNTKRLEVVCKLLIKGKLGVSAQLLS